MNAICDKYFRLGLLLVVVIAVFVRALGLSDYSFVADFDEYHTTKSVLGFYESKISKQAVVDISSIESHTLTDAVKDANRDYGNAFSYNLFLHGYSKIFGTEDYVLRAFSLLCDLLSLFLIVRIGKTMGVRNSRILLACLLFALFPFLVGFGRVIRTYAFTMTIALLLALVVLRSDRFKKSWLVISLIGILSVTLFLGHYLSYYIVIALAIFFFIHRKKIPIHYQRLWKGLVIGGLVIGGYVFIHYQSLAALTVRSNEYKEVVKTSDLESIREKSLTLGTFITSSFEYLNAHYIGSGLVLKTIRFLYGKDVGVLFSIVFLLPAIILLWNRDKQSQTRLWSNLFIVLFVAGNLSAFFLVAVSGHMISLGPKYTMFTIPFYIMTIAFFVKKNAWTIGAFGAIFLVQIFAHYFPLRGKYLKQIKVEFTESSNQETYLSSDYPQLKRDLNKLLVKYPGDTVFVYSTNELVFIKSVFPKLDYKYAYLQEYDDSKEFEGRLLPLRFAVPD